MASSQYSRLDHDGPKSFESEKTLLAQPNRETEKFKTGFIVWRTKGFLLIWSLAAVSLLCYAYTYSAKAKPSHQENENGYDDAIILDRIPKSCQVWFDGCNTCHRGEPGSPFACTKMFCPPGTLKEPFCKKEFPSDENNIKKDCQVWFDGCNTCRRSKPDSPFSCTEMFCPHDKMKEPFCKEKFPSNENSDKKDCQVWFDGCNTCHRNEPDSPFACTMKYCPSDTETMEEPYCKQKFPTEKITRNPDVRKRSRNFCVNSKQQRCRRICNNEPACGDGQCLMREDYCCKFSCQDL